MDMVQLTEYLFIKQNELSDELDAMEQEEFPDQIALAMLMGKSQMIRSICEYLLCNTMLADSN